MIRCIGFPCTSYPRDQVYVVSLLSHMALFVHESACASIHDQQVCSSNIWSIAYALSSRWIDNHKLSCYTSVYFFKLATSYTCFVQAVCDPNIPLESCPLVQIPITFRDRIIIASKCEPCIRCTPRDETARSLLRSSRYRIIKRWSKGFS